MKAAKKVVKGQDKDQLKNDVADAINATQVDETRMCKLPVENLQHVCDWLNSDSMPLPQNQIRAVLALLLVAEEIKN
jgi:hypothetical protein